MARDSKSTKKILSFLLIIMGLALIFQGYQISDSAGSEITQAVTGSYTDDPMMFYIGGVICLIVGIVI